jgi:hypothetical protein
VGAQHHLHEVTQPLEREHQTRRADADPDSHQCGQCEEPSHLPFCQGTDGWQSADVREGIRHQGQARRHNRLGMAFKSHLFRSLDIRRPSNIWMAAIAVVTGVLALVLWLGGDSGEVFLAPVLAFLMWALVREVDPDHDSTALVVAVLTSTWVLTGGSVISGLAVTGLLVAARVITSTTGRRLLLTDLAGITLFGIAIGFTVEGWAAGFGIAIAIYLDERFREEHRLEAIAAGAVTALGTTVVATAAGAFPDHLPNVIQYLAVGAGLVALALLVRDPATPTTMVDARYAAFLDTARLHVSRSVVGVLVFLTTILIGAEARGTVILIAALALVVVSNEIELLRRRGQ